MNGQIGTGVDIAYNAGLATREYVKKREIYNAPYVYPDWWTGIKIPISVKNGMAVYNYDVSDNITLSDYTPYFISPTGNDANDGLSQLTPKAKLSNAISAGAQLVYMMPGTYLRDTFLTENKNTGGNDLIVIGIGEVNVTTGQGGLSWVLSTNNTYRATRSAVTDVIDLNFKNNDGFYKTLKKVSSQALCEAEAGTYFTDNVGVWVHTEDERIPDSNLLPTVFTGNSVLVNSGKIYFENINMYGIELRCFGTDNASTLEVYCKNINIPLCRKALTGNATYNSFRFDNFKTVVLQGCKGYNSALDIFNYHNSLGVTEVNILELECEGYNAGITGTGLSNQCSTAHDSCNIIRLNCNYYGGNVQVVTDVFNTQTIMIGCELNTGQLQPNTRIFQAADADVFGCRLIGDKQIIQENGTEGIKIYNSIVDYSTTTGIVIIE